MSDARTGLRCFTLEEIPKHILRRAALQAQRELRGRTPEDDVAMTLRLRMLAEHPWLAEGRHWVPRAAWDAVMGRP